MKKKIPSEASTLENHIGFWLRFVSNRVSGRFENLLAAHDVKVAEWVALRVLYQRKHTTHAELIDALGMTKGAASKIITKLESKGLAERSPSKDSAREQELSLTKAGNELVPILAAVADENDAHFFGHLSENQRQGLMNLMKDLVSHHQLKQIPTE
jgi:DNA-binding MarR family transcriptional regulator